MPQVKAKVDWLENTHITPKRERVRIDNSDVTIENDRMEEAKVQLLDSLHLEKHRALMGQQQEIKTAKNHVYNYRRVKNVIDPSKGLSCSMLVRRSRSFADSSLSLDDSSNTIPELPERSNSWSNVPLPDNVTSWDPDFGRLPPVPFARQPVKMRYIPSVSSSYMDNGMGRRNGGKPKVSPNEFGRRRTEILNQKDSQIGRSYQTLRELSDVSKLSESGKGALRKRVLKERGNILNLYHQDLRSKIEMFHKRMDRYIIENREKQHYNFTEQRTLPKIY